MRQLLNLHFRFRRFPETLKLTHPCSVVLHCWKNQQFSFFFFNSERHSVVESSSDESHMEATQAQMTCWYSKRHCNIWAFVANWQCIFCTWYLILVEARFGVRLISWSSTIGVKPLAFIGVFRHLSLLTAVALLVPLPWNLWHLESLARIFWK